MGYPARMKKVRIAVHNTYLDPLIAALHEAGLVQFFDPDEEGAFEPDAESGVPEHYLQQVTVPREASQCVSLVQRIDRAREVLDEAKPPGPGFVKSFVNRSIRPKREVTHRTLKSIIDEAEELLDSVEPVTDAASAAFTEMRERENTLTLQQMYVDNLAPLGVDLGYVGSGRRVVVRAGWVDDIDALDQAMKSVKDATYIKSVADGGAAVIVAAHIDERAALDQVLRGRFFQEYELGDLSGTPEDARRRIEKEYAELEAEREEHMEKLRNIRNQYLKDLEVRREELRIERSRLQVRQRFRATRYTTILYGWVLKQNVYALLDLCSKQTEGHVEVRLKDPAEDEEVPVKMKNPRWAEPFEELTKLFATPRYNEIDPTVLIGPAFVIFFGLMLGDAGYGLLLLGFALYGYIKIGPYSALLRKAAYIGILMGGATIFFGILMGSFFGNLLPTFFYPQIAGEKMLLYEWSFEMPLYGMVHLPYDPIPQPLFLLIVSLILGLFQLNVSLATAAYQNIKKGDYRSVFTAQVSWWLFQPTFGILAWWFIFGGAFARNTLIGALIGVAVSMVLFAMESGGIFIFDITGFMGDWLSYSRILALGLATAGLALTINIVGELLGAGGLVLGIAAGAIVIVAHFFNFILQALGAGIHSLRLQFVEFFNRCYEGGGHFFRPFTARRTHTQLEVEHA